MSQPLQGGPYANCAVVPDVFQAEELDRIIALGQRLSLEQGKIQLGEADTSLRKSRVAQIAANAETRWLYERLMNVVAAVNRQAWRFDIESMQPIQYGEYGENEYYHWHMDLGEVAVTQRRKISITVQLDDPAIYDGGDLEFWTGGTQSASRARGGVVVFPSYLLHRVTPVTRGLRRSLAAWTLGTKPFS
jgi:PKHD-type hydroxylase